MEQDLAHAIQIPTLIIVGCVISVVGFILVGLISIVGYFIKQIYNEYKDDKKAYGSDKKTFDDKIEKVAEVFATKLEKTFEKISVQIDQVKQIVSSLTDTVRGLTSALQQVEKDTQAKHGDMHKRLDEHHEAIELTRKRIHDQANQITPMYLDWQRRKQEDEKIKAAEALLLKNSEN
jgi:uncharacterized coiled-coil protein SlyX